MQIGDKEFEVLLTEEQIASAVSKMSRAISKDYQSKDVVLLSVLNGAFIFTADLIREIDINVEVTFVKVRSYEGTASSGKVRELIGLEAELKGRHVLLVEDIVDSGYTINYLLDMLKAQEPASIHIATLLFKPDALKVTVDLKYVGVNIPNRFVVGYGLDYNGLGRQYREVYQLKA
ncbi:MAG: hypoxanthine phosphoribosyltransferase [Cyclobacteriaceae bacterium]